MEGRTKELPGRTEREETCGMLQRASIVVPHTLCAGLSGSRTAAMHMLIHGKEASESWTFSMSLSFIFVLIFTLKTTLRLLGFPNSESGENDFLALASIEWQFSISS